METPTEWACAGLIYGSAPHYIDHLAPLCALLKIPLLVTEDESARALKIFYPEVETVQVDAISMPEFLVSNIEIVFLSTPRILFDEIFFFAQKLHNKRIHTIWCPHGNSDKGHSSLFMEGLNKEEFALVYGRKMIDFLKEKGAFKQLKKCIVTGNFRKDYYLQHKAFYDEVVQKKVLSKLPKRNKTILYAPTWADRESSSSFAKATPILIENLPPHYNLIIKPHPNLFTEDEEVNRSLIEKYRDTEGVYFLLDFPPIHPLLTVVDLYIGDFSSVGYDFLTWNKPMFFLNEPERNAATDMGLYLYRCGIEIKPSEYKSVYKIIDSHIESDFQSFHAIRNEVNLYTFEPTDMPSLKKEIEASYDRFPDKDLNFY